MNNSALKTIGSMAIRPRHSLGTASRSLLSMLMLVLCLSFGVGQARAQCGSLGAPSTTWQNGGNSFWNLDGNWTSGTPTASTNACILNGLSTVTLNTTGNAKGLQLATGNSLNINAGESLSLVSGTTLNYGTINAGGALTDTSGANFTNNGTLNGSAALTNSSGARLTNNGAITNGVTLTNTSGAHLTNYGSMDNGLGFGTLINTSGAFLTNYGGMNGGGTYINSSGAHFTNYGDIINTPFSVGSSNVGGTLTNSSGAHFTNYGGITNNGTITNNSGAIFTNYGSIGTFFFGLGSFNNSGTLINNSGASLDFEDAGLGNTGRLNNSGTISVIDGGLGNGGTLNNTGTMSFSSPMSDGGSLSNSGILNNKGTINAIDNSQCDGSVCFISNSGTINNRGTINLANRSEFGSPYFTNSGTLSNSGALNLNGTSIDNSGIFRNSGAVTIDSSSLFTTSTNYTQRAGSTLVDGILTATGSAIVDIKGGTLGGTGTINGDVLMKGIMLPGASGVPGTFTINGDYEQTSTGVFDELISGSSSNGLLDVTGVLALDPGSLLEVTLQGGFNPLGDSFTILNYGSLVGEFSNGSEFFADGFEWTLSYGSNDAVLTAVSTPEPGSMSLIAIGFVALLGFAAKRRAAL
jgi:fibronectin-binding autotransporter adhesin